MKSRYGRVLFGLLVLGSMSVASHAQATDLSGHWQSPSGRSIRFFKDGNQWVGHTERSYSDHWGRKTGEKIEYYFTLKRSQNSPSQYKGELATFDSHYNCSFENGEVRVYQKSADQLEMIIPTIQFKVVTRTVRGGGQAYRRPYYCRDSWGYEYICGWRWQQGPSEVRKRSRQCKVTQTHLQGLELTRLNNP